MKEKVLVKSKSHGGAVVVLWCLKGEDRFPAVLRALLRWFQSERNRSGRMKKVWLFSNRQGGVMVKAVVYEAQGSEDRFPAGPRALLIKLISEWKKKD